MIGYLKKRKLVCFLLLLFVVLFSLQRMIWYTVGYDTASYLYWPETMLQSWYTHSRFMLVFLKRAFPFLSGNLLALNILTYVHAYIYTILFLYFLNLKPANEQETPDVKRSLLSKEDVRDLFCGMFLVSSPFFLEQYYFTLQSAEISLCFILITISFLTTWHALTAAQTRIRLLLFGVSTILVFFTVSVYQYFAVMYLVGALFCLIKLQKTDPRSNLLAILQCAVVFLIGIAFYVIVNKLVLSMLGLAPDSYLGNEWTRLERSAVMVRVVDAFASTLKGYGHAYTLSFFLAIFYLLIRFFRADKKRTWEHFYYLCMLLAPYLLVLFWGNLLLERTAIAFTYVTVFVYFLALNDPDKIAGLYRVLLIGYTAIQVFRCQRMLYGDHLRYEGDLAIAHKIYEDCSLTPDTQVFFMGKERTEENTPLYKGATIGSSFFEWGIDDEQVSQEAIYTFMALEGYPYAYPGPELCERAGQISIDSEYPNGQYYQKTEHGYVVNLGD